MEIGEKTFAELNESGAYDKPILTELAEFKVFFEAEEGHKNYFLNNLE